MELRLIPHTLIDPSPYQPRKDLGDLEALARSIAQVGLLQPLVVRPKGERYELLAGHRRLEALRRLGWDKVPAVVREATEEEARQAVVHENEVRQQLDPYSLALYLRENLKRVLGLDEEALWRLLSRVFRGLEVDPGMAARLREVLAAYGIKEKTFYVHYRPLLSLPPALVSELARRRAAAGSTLKSLHRWLAGWRTPLGHLGRYWVALGGSLESRLDPEELVQRAFFRFLQENPPGLDARGLRALLRAGTRDLMLAPHMRDLKPYLGQPAPGELLEDTRLEEVLLRAMRALWEEVRGGGRGSGRLPPGFLAEAAPSLAAWRGLEGFFADLSALLFYALVWEAHREGVGSPLPELFRGLARQGTAYLQEALALAAQEGQLHPEAADRLHLVLERRLEGFLQEVEEARLPAGGEAAVVGLLGRAWAVAKQLYRQAGVEPAVPPPVRPLEERLRDVGFTLQSKGST